MKLSTREICVAALIFLAANSVFAVAATLLQDEEVLCVVRVAPGEERVNALRDAISERCGAGTRRARIEFPDGGQVTARMLGGAVIIRD